jgi:hypothetical protein
VADLLISKNRWKPLQPFIYKIKGIVFATTSVDAEGIFSSTGSNPECVFNSLERIVGPASIKVHADAFIQGWYQGEDHDFYVENVSDLIPLLELMESSNWIGLSHPGIMVTKDYYLLTQERIKNG